MENVLGGRSKSAKTTEWKPDSGWATRTHTRVAPAKLTGIGTAPTAAHIAVHEA